MGTMTVNTTEASPEVVRVERGDVVLVNYTLWVGSTKADNQEGKVYVDDPDVKVSEELVKEFPDIHVPPNVGFRKALEGMTEGEEKYVTIPPEEGFTNPDDEYYGQELYYRILLKKILLDSSKPPTTITDIPFLIPLIILTIILISGIIAYKTYQKPFVKALFYHGPHCKICGAPAELKCAKQDCMIPYCEKCYLENGHCIECKSNRYIRLK